MKEELHPTRLGTTDEKGRRIMPQPKDVSGRWKNRRSIFYSLLLVVYLVLPWIYIDGAQWVLLDIPKREFTLFGALFHAYDSVYLIFVFLGFMLAIAFVTSVWGRVWCGWACPQTVFIDFIYRKVERVIEGSARKRKALNAAPLSFGKILKKGAKWTVFLIISLHIVHSFLGYFVGTRELLSISFQSPSENWTLFVIMLTLTAIVLFDFGWFREQFCIIACPYGRFQSVLMDDNSLVVAYDEKRGEPRRAKGLPASDEGDCISCSKCVKVCPTGIDIRRGVQMECIACTMCIDACDEIMRKVGRPEGLIRYSSANELEGKKRKIGARSFLYIFLFLVVFVSGAYGLKMRGELAAQFLRMQGEPFSKIVTDAGDFYLNRFEARIKVNGRRGGEVSLTLAPEAQKRFSLISGEVPKKIDEDMVSVSFFVKFKKDALIEGKQKLPILIDVVMPSGTRESLTKEVGIVGPL